LDEGNLGGVGKKTGEPLTNLSLTNQKRVEKNNLPKCRSHQGEKGLRRKGDPVRKNGWEGRKRATGEASSVIKESFEEGGSSNWTLSYP